MTPRLRIPALAWFLAILLAPVLGAPAAAQTRVADLTVRQGDVPRRLVGYGLVVGLDGTGDRSFGGVSGQTPSVRSVVNLLRRFNVEVPAERLRLRNVAAVLVTAEVSPFLRAGGRFEVQVSAIGDATTLKGGVLWMTPLVTDPNQPAVATAQGPLYVAANEQSRGAAQRWANSARLPSGGVLEVDPPAVATSTRLVLREPGLAAATRIAGVVNAAFGPSTARVEDPGAIALTVPQAQGGDVNAFLAAVDTLAVSTPALARVVIDAREGTVVAGAGVQVGGAVVSHHGITLEIGGRARAATPAGAAAAGLVRVDGQASVQDVAAGLHAAGAKPDEIAAIFESLRAVGALHADVVLR
jgi:flagellar P-ring protein precursor FlgI